MGQDLNASEPLSTTSSNLHYHSERMEQELKDSKATSQLPYNETMVKTSTVSQILPPEKKSPEDVLKDVQRKNKLSVGECEHPAPDSTCDYGEVELVSECMLSRREKSDSVGGLGRRIISKSQMRGKSNSNCKDVLKFLIVVS